MSPERWQKVQDLYHAASERPSAERQRFLEEACAGDDLLRRELDELVAQSDDSPNLLDRPALQLLDRAELDPGQLLGPYRIESLIGSGGMGRVYKATDTRLGRAVAIKVSRAGFTGRFRREARAVAALNHPSICTLYDLGPNYLVMEFVAGAPLAGPMPLPQALKVAIAIADALDTAHRRGVIHRDLKPANILLTESGPKLLDFGLAKLDPASQSVIPDSMTRSVADAAIAGTIQYMSPEQLQGRGADARSDIFSFGLVFFELLTGRPAFESDNSASLIAAILTTQPDARRLVPSLPTAVDRVLQRALAKNPDDRWQSARDLKAALECLAPPPAAVPRPARNRAAWVVAAVFALTSAILAWVQWGPALVPPQNPATVEAAFSRTPQLVQFDRRGKVLGSVGAPADYSNPAFSPDGKRLAVSIRDSTRRRDIWIFDLVNGTQTPLTNDPADETNPVWSPDGRAIVYCSERLGRRDIYTRPATGGPERLVLQSDVNKNPLDWDGRAIYFNVDRPDGSHDIWLLPISPEVKGARAFLRDSENRDWLAISPDSRWMLFRAGGHPGNRIALRALEPGGPEIPIARGASEGHWRRDGRQIYFIADRTMMSQTIDTQGPEPLLGKATPLFRVPAPYTFGRNAFTVSPDGQRFVLRTGT
jgi:serine/threonine protein kinase